ncbi:MAG: toll/interleukin-1 receptor domain-containing protein [Pseudonocardiaceae bacterium]
MTDVFVSYARKDLLFVRRLTAALRARGRKVWVDLEDIIPSTRWMAEIRTAITEADAVVVVITPDSVASEVCRIELDCATEASKRLVPILARETPADGVPSALAELNWLSFLDGTDFEAGVDRLVEILDTDLDRVHSHTRLLTQARAWETRDHDRSLLLRGAELKEAETWLADQTGRKPAATPTQAQLVLASRRATTRRQRGIGVTGVAVAVVLAVLTTFAFIQRQTAIHERGVAISRAVAGQANAVGSSNPSLAMQLSLIAYRAEHTPEALNSLLGASTLHSAARVLGNAGAFYAAAISVDGHTLAVGCANQAIRLYDIRNPRVPILKGNLTDHIGTVNAVAFSPDGRNLASASEDGTARLWNLTKSRPPTLAAILTAQADPIYAVSFSSDGRTLATGSSDGTVRLWDGIGPHHPTLTATLTTTGHADAVEAVAFSPDGHTLAIGKDDGRVQLLNVVDPHHPAAQAALNDHTSTVYGVAFSPDGRTFASASSDGTAKLWDVTDSSHPTLLATTNRTTAVDAVAFSPDGHTLAIGATDGTVRRLNLIDPHHPAALPTLNGGYATNSIGENRISAVAFSPDGHTLASASFNGTAQLWDITDPYNPTRLARTSQTGDVYGAALGPDGRTLAVGSNITTQPFSSAVQLWDLTDLRHPIPAATITSQPNNLLDTLAFRPDGYILAVGNADGTVPLWEVTDPYHPTLSATLTGGQAAGALVAFSTDGHTLASVSFDRGVRLWDVTDLHHPILSATLIAQAGVSGGVAFSPVGHTLAFSRYDGAVPLWDVTDPRHPTLSATLTGQTGLVSAVGFSPDGHTLAVGRDDRTVTLWDITDSRHASSSTTITAHTNVVSAVGFSPDGHTLAIGGNDGSVQLWTFIDSRHFALAATLTRHTSRVTTVVFSPDRQHTLVSGSYDGAVLLSDTDPDQAAKDICSVVVVPITPAQWQQYVPVLSYNPPCKLK